MRRGGTRVACSHPVPSNKATIAYGPAGLHGPPHRPPDPSLRARPARRPSHLDVKRLGRIPSGGGHRVHGRAAGTVNRRADRSAGGYDYLHAAVDDHSRLACVEILGDERAQRCARCWRRAHHWFALHGITVQRVLTDNGVGYRSRCSGRRWPQPACAISRPDPIGPRRTGRWSGSTDPAGGVGYRRLYWSNAARTVLCSPGSIGTTITAPTPPSAGGHPSAASTTFPAITPRTRRAGRCPGAGRPGRSGGPRTGPGRGRRRPNGRWSRPRGW
jgi:hypothetical protein